MWLVSCLLCQEYNTQFHNSVLGPEAYCKHYYIYVMMLLLEDYEILFALAEEKQLCLLNTMKSLSKLFTEGNANV